ncbi:MAG TPA: VCBS repeat-containing protein [Planctomycetota bacterium]|nr:VCBS repeat-containing protein [Planctomycetota bacterium]
MADLNGDGHADMISGSYWPGDISIFYGQGGGKWAAAEFAKDAEGKNANAGPPWASKNKPQMDSLAAAPWLVDWDGDGDLDLLVGNIAGHVVLLANEGGPKTPKFVRKGPIEAGGAVLDVDNNDAGPTTADWDGDGLWDLIVGGGAGSVVFFRNEGTRTAPKFAAGVPLVKGNGHGTLEHGQQPTAAASRCKPHVCDWNGDGALDLLVGDFASVTGAEPELSEAQKATKAKLVAERSELSQKQGKLLTRCDNDLERLTGDDKKQWDAVRERIGKVYEALRPLEAENKFAGFVWVYLQRKPANAAGGSGSGASGSAR